MIYVRFTPESGHTEAQYLLRCLGLFFLRLPFVSFIDHLVHPASFDFFADSRQRRQHVRFLEGRYSVPSLTGMSGKALGFDEDPRDLAVGVLDFFLQLADQRFHVGGG